MNRTRALGYALAVGLVVFYALAAPLLRDLFGPGVVLLAYGVAAAAAGAVTYRLARQFGGDASVDDRVAELEAELPSPEEIRRERLAELEREVERGDDAEADVEADRET